MISSEVQRTLVKSPPELWAELSDPAALARHLGEFGEIRITRIEPESAIEWEARGHERHRADQALGLGHEGHPVCQPRDARAGGRRPLEPSRRRAGAAEPGGARRARRQQAEPEATVHAGRRARHDVSADRARGRALEPEPLARAQLEIAIATEPERSRTSRSRDRQPASSPSRRTSRRRPRRIEPDGRAHGPAAPSPVRARDRAQQVARGVTAQSALDARPAPRNAPQLVFAATVRAAVAATRTVRARAQYELGVTAQATTAAQPSSPDSLRRPSERGGRAGGARRRAISDASSRRPTRRRDGADRPSDRAEPVETADATERRAGAPVEAGRAACDSTSCRAASGSDLGAELSAAEDVAAEQVTAVLTAVLDRLGSAHHRPFSRA